MSTITAFLKRYLFHLATSGVLALALILLLVNRISFDVAECLSDFLHFEPLYNLLPWHCSHFFSSRKNFLCHYSFLPAHILEYFWRAALSNYFLILVWYYDTVVQKDGVEDFLFSCYCVYVRKNVHLWYPTFKIRIIFLNCRKTSKLWSRRWWRLW